MAAKDKNTEANPTWKKTYGYEGADKLWWSGAKIFFEGGLQVG